jgi:nucleoside-triphosphatase THEP1
MDKPLYYYTGPVQTGKTTRIAEWASKNNCTGILAPIINGKRHLRDIKSGEVKLLENDSNIDAISIGRYYFKKEVFEWGRQKLLAEYESEPEWFVIDEYGKLELRDEGLEPAISMIINQWKINKKNNLLIIVRDYLVNDLFKKFDKGINFEEFNI